MPPTRFASGWVAHFVGRLRSGSELRLSTGLSADEVLNRLRQASLRPDFFRVTGPAQSVVGRFKGGRFSLVAAQAIRHTQARYFQGEVQSKGTTTVIHGRFQRRPAIRIAWWTILSIVILTGLFNSVHTGDPKAAIIALFAIAALALLDRHQMGRSAPFEDDVRDFLIRVTTEGPRS